MGAGAAGAAGLEITTARLAVRRQVLAAFFMSAGVTARRFSYSVLMRLGSLYRAALSASELAVDNALPRGLTVERRIATRARSSSLAVTGSARTLAISSEIRPSTSSAVLPGRTM